MILKGFISFSCFTGLGRCISTMLNRNDGEYPCLDFDFRGDNVNIMTGTIKFTVGLFVGLFVCLVNALCQNKEVCLKAKKARAPSLLVTQRKKKKSQGG